MSYRSNRGQSSWTRALQQPFVLFSIVMILKIALVWLVVFKNNGGSLGMTILSGMTPVWFLFCLIENFLHRRKMTAYIVLDLIITAIYFAVIMYYKYFGVIVTYHELRQVNQVSEVNSSVFSLMDPYYLLIFADILFLALMPINRNYRAWGRGLAVRGRRSWLAVGQIVMLLGSIAFILPHRSSMNEFEQARGMGILNYEVYLAFAPSKDVKVAPGTVTPEKIAELKGKTEPAQPVMQGVAKGKNLIIVQLEAFQNFLIDLKIDGQEITPNMNKLAKEALYFPHFFQQVGQGNTADAEFVVNTSLYVPPNGAASEVYADRDLPGLPKTMEENGYKTATFHTNDVVFWNRDQLYKALGWEQFYDINFFGKEDPIAFAASDEVLYDKTVKELDSYQQSGQPFYAQLISMSGHHPFRIPESKFKMKLPERFEGTLVGDYIQAQNYADFALGQLFDKLKASGLWDNSVIVFYGDHQGLPIYSLNSKEQKLMEEIYKRNYTLPDMMNIPLIVSVPGAEPAVYPQIGGQSDIYPTVANLLGIPMDQKVHFGQDLLNETGNLLPERYYMPSGSIITQNGAFIPGTGYADGETYPLDGGSSTSPAVTKEEYDRAHMLISMSDLFVRSLPEWADSKHAPPVQAAPKS